MRRERFLESVREIKPREKFDSASGAFEALKRLAECAYGAAVCVVESPDEIALVVRIKKARHDLPVVMMTSIKDPAISALGQQMGADRVLRMRENPRRNAEGLLRVLEIREAFRHTRHHFIRTKESVRDIVRLNAANRHLIAEMLGVAAACERGEFFVLIVEDSDDDYFLLSHRLKKSGLPSCYRRVETVPEALRYLRGEGGYQDRDLFPVPSLIISDLNLPGMSGLDLLRIVREEASLKDLGFVLYTSSEREEDSAEAVRLGANFYVVKSSTHDPMAEILHSIFARFIQERTGFPP
jgi:two-component system response regulator